MQRGQKHTPESIAHLRALNSGRNNPMYGRTGDKHPLYGKPRSEDVLQKMRVAATGRDKISKSVSGERHPLFGKKFSAETRLKQRLAKLGRKNPHVGVPRTNATRKKMSASRTGRGNSFFGRKHTEETKNKLRVANLRHLQVSGGYTPCVGLNETILLDEQEKIDGVRILRQYYLPELGYTVDGYCVETNTVYEVYEPFHNRQVQRDLRREIRICNHLSCEFHILWDRRT